MSLYDQSYQLFKGEVTAVENQYDPNDSTVWIGVKIYVKNVDHTDDSLAKEAFPPTHMPTSTVGGGSLSVPSVGQECMCCWHPRTTKYQILSYTTKGEISPFGGLSPEKVEEGDLVTKIGGKVKSIFTLGSGGKMKMHSNM